MAAWLIAIIAILASLLLPTLQNAKAKAQQSTCAANLKQVVFATLTYADENDERLPTSCFDNPSNPGNVWDSFTWDDLIRPGLGEDHVFRCPMDPMPEPARTYAANTWVLGNGELQTDWWLGAPVYARALAGVPDPSRYICYTERWAMSTTRVIGRANYYRMKASLSRYDAVHGMAHSANCAFVDGHVAWYRYETTLSPTKWQW